MSQHNIMSQGDIFERPFLQQPWCLVLIAAMAALIASPPFEILKQTNIWQPADQYMATLDYIHITNALLAIIPLVFMGNLLIFNIDDELIVGELCLAIFFIWPLL